jgi:hypothetical protein
MSTSKRTAVVRSSSPLNGTLLPLLCILGIMMGPFEALGQAKPDLPNEIYGVDKHTKRMTNIFTPQEFLEFVERANVTGIDLTEVKRVNGLIDTAFNLVAVSGTLEDGFPLRGNLDFEVGTPNEVLSTFLGTALIRGLRANLDIKNPGWREFKTAGDDLDIEVNVTACIEGITTDAGPDDLSNCVNVNPGMVATGVWNDANIYSVYLIDRRQAVKALLNEPRFLSMTPDLAMVDLEAKETTKALTDLIQQAIEEENLPEPKNTKFATLLTVVSTWPSCQFVESPVIETKKDGTRVTDFPNSLAAYADANGEVDTEVTDELRISSSFTDRQLYYGAVERAIRKAVVYTSQEACQEGNALRLINGRFLVTATWSTPAGESGEGQPVQFSTESGYFYFFSPTNVEVVVKVIDACNLSNHFWVFSAGLTNVDVELTVLDTVSGETKTYRNSQNTAFLPIQDTRAFATCP